MQRVIDFIIRYRQHIVAVLLAIMSLAMMLTGNVAQLGGFRALVIGGLGIAQDAFAWIPNPIALKQENEALRQINMELLQQVMLLRKAGLENEQLRRMLQLKTSSSLPLRAATVVGKTSFRTRQYITIDLGFADGVAAGMNVITDAGLVGVVIGVSRHYALVQTLFNRDVRVSARLASSRTEGIITWDGFEYLLLQHVSKTQQVKIGELIITSSLSSRYIPEIPIGKVKSVSPDPNSLFHRIVVEPAVAFWRLEQVFVVMQPPQHDLIQLEQALQEYINRYAAGK